jgi:hypothetical protein
MNRRRGSDAPFSFLEMVEAIFVTDLMIVGVFLLETRGGRMVLVSRC